jgi:hypothetical protein
MYRGLIYLFLGHHSPDNFAVLRDYSAGCVLVCFDFADTDAA